MNTDTHFGLDKEKYQVFLFSCPANVPVQFARHSWFVVNRQGAVSRWEILQRVEQSETHWGHLYLNFSSPFRGIEILPFPSRFFWKAKLLGTIEGEEAKRMAEFIEKAPNTYPYCRHYVLTGPNSNTFTQWVLNHFPEFSVKLPWHAIGKHYKVNSLIAKDLL